MCTQPCFVFKAYKETSEREQRLYLCHKRGCSHSPLSVSQQDAGLPCRQVVAGWCCLKVAEMIVLVSVTQMQGGRAAIFSTSLSFWLWGGPGLALRRV